MNDMYFDNVAGIGSLYLEHIFFDFESEPILFTCSDTDKNLYFCLCSEIRYNQKWLITKSNINILKELIEEKIDIVSALLINPNIIVIDMDLEGKENSRIIEKNKIDRLDLPKEGIYLRCNKEKARSYLWKKEYQNLHVNVEWALQMSAEMVPVVKNYCITTNEKYNEFGNRLGAYYNSFYRNYCNDKNSLYKDKISRPERKRYDYSVNVSGMYAGYIENTETVDADNNDYVQAA